MWRRWSQRVDGVFAGVLALLRDAFRRAQSPQRSAVSGSSRERKQLVYYKDTSKHCTEPRRGIALALSNAAKLDACI